MKWKLLLVFPVSAWLLGESAQPPALKISLPVSDPCPTYESAKRSYLLAYAWAQNDARKSQLYLWESQEALANCGESAKALRDRIDTRLRY